MMYAVTTKQHFNIHTGTLNDMMYKGKEMFQNKVIC